MAKRLLCILSSMNAGGAETFLMKIYRTIDREKYQFDFCINSKDKCFYEDEIIELGGRIFRIPSKTESLLLFKKELTNIVKTNEYKYVLRITANAAGLLDLKIAKQAGACVCVARSSNSNVDGGLISILSHKVGQIIYPKYVDVQIAPSDLAALYTFGKQAYRNGEVHIIHNALNVDDYKYSKQFRELLREELGIPIGAYVIGHIGRFTKQKNHEKLIDIFLELFAKDKNVFLLLVGIGELENYIKDKVEKSGISNNVVFAGIRTDIPHILSTMDVFVMPSLYEGMPNTVIEAQANGLPCVISSTITKEADITGNVTFLSLDSSNQIWANTIMCHLSDSRADTHEKFNAKGYNISAVSNDFVKLVFGESSND